MMSKKGLSKSSKKKIIIACVVIAVIAIAGILIYNYYKAKVLLAPYPTPPLVFCNKIPGDPNKECRDAQVNNKCYTGVCDTRPIAMNVCWVKMCTSSCGSTGSCEPTTGKCIAIDKISSPPSGDYLVMTTFNGRSCGTCKSCSLGECINNYAAAKGYN